MKSISTTGQHFSQVPHADIERSTFDRTHAYKTTFDAGKLIPFVADEVLPGDTFKLDATIFARLATPIFPLMDNANMDTHFFFVPNRLLWNNWERFMGSQDNPADSTDYVIPKLETDPSSEVFIPSSLGDYFGLETNTNGIIAQTNALHFRAYNLIYNEWYRDQNLQHSVTVELDDGPDPISHYNVLDRGKRHDYFTSCLPWPQKGDAVPLPNIGQYEVSTITTLSDGIYSPLFTQFGAVKNLGEFDAPKNTIGTISSSESGNDLLFRNLYASIDADSTSTITGTGGGTINDLRLAFQTQKLLERDARGGTRYTEIIKAHFNVTSPDARLQRPEYLGGGSAPVTTSPIAKTSSTDTTSPQANLSAIGTVTSNRNGFSKSFTEHGVIIGIVSVRADLTYQHMHNRMWSRQTKYDFFWPALAHIGEQAVLNKEIFVQGTDEDNEVFGYQERYAEYRYKPSQITGLFRSKYPQNLDSWHLSQNFTQLPNLNSDFIIEQPPFDRVIAVPSEPHFIFDSYIQMKCTRPMPVYGVPGMMDRF